MMWALFIVPGMMAFLLNFGALACVAMGQAGTDSPGASTLLLIRLSSLAGLLGVVPVLAREDLICTCETELCFRNDLLCKLNQTSMFVVMAASFCLLYKFVQLLAHLQKSELRFYNAKTLQLVWVVPLVLAVISFGVEEHGNDRFHLAKAGVRCQFRYHSIRDEALLLHVPMALCVITMGRFIVGNLKICLEIVLLQNAERSFRNAWAVLKTRPQLQKMMFISCTSAIIIVVWLSHAMASWWISENYLQAMDKWLQCIRFDFARHTAYGITWTDTIGSYKDGKSCPAFPEGVELFELQLLKGIFEALLPGMVAMTFSWRLINDALQAWRVARVKAGEKSTTAVAPLNFDSRAYDRESECSPSQKTTRKKSMDIRGAVAVSTEAGPESRSRPSSSKSGGRSAQSRPTKKPLTVKQRRSTTRHIVDQVLEETILNTRKFNPSGPSAATPEVSAASVAGAEAPSEAIGVGATPHDSETIALEQEVSEALKTAQEIQRQECSRTKKEVVQTPPLKQGSRSLVSSKMRRGLL
jgi:hypothetical protein